MERQPNNNNKDRLCDADLVELAVARAIEEERDINDATARVIASLHHGGQSSAMYSFVSTGAISDRLSVEIDREYLEADMNDRHELRTWMVLLGAYVNGIGERGPVDGWNRIWIDRGLNEPSDSSASCGEHFSDPHAVGCALENDESEPLSLGEVIRRKFIGVSTASLIRHMEQAEDFSTDDEEVELSRRMREIGKTWCWSPGFTDPRIEVSDGGES